MANTTTGTDNQDNFISCSAASWSIGSGGKSPQQINGPLNPPVYDATKPPVMLNGANPSANELYDAIAKFGEGANVVLFEPQIAQGHQDSLNLNNHATVTLHGGDLATNGAQGLRVVTVKGGSSLIAAVAPVTLHQHGSVADVQLNAWSDQSYSLAAADLTEFCMADGSKVKVRTRSMENVIMGPHCQRDYVGSLLDFVYWWFKYSVRAVLRIPVGKSGPSWLS